MQKVVAWDKRSPWASAGCVRGKALTQYSVFTVWLMESKSLTEVKRCNRGLKQEKSVSLSPGGGNEYNVLH